MSDKGLFERNQMLNDCVFFFVFLKSDDNANHLKQNQVMNIFIFRSSVFWDAILNIDIVKLD